jgi:hypothetical protein
MISPGDVAQYIPEQYWQPDFFSLDIDSFDYEVASTLLKSGFRPAVVCCEINKNFGIFVERFTSYEWKNKKKF